MLYGIILPPGAGRLRAGLISPTASGPSWTSTEGFSLWGESHGSAFNQQLESALVEFFVREGGVGSLLLELPPA